MIVEPELVETGFEQAMSADPPPRLSAGFVYDTADGRDARHA